MLQQLVPPQKHDGRGIKESNGGDTCGWHRAGVEFAGTLSDFVRVDLKRKFPELMQYVKVTLIQSASSILTQFDSRLQAQALNNFEKTGVTVRTGVRVTEVTYNEVIHLPPGCSNLATKRACSARSQSRVLQEHGASEGWLVRGCRSC